MGTALVVTAGAGSALMLATVLLTLALARFFKSTIVVALIGGLAIPLAVAIWGIVDLAVNLDVDDTAPGNLLIGGILLLVVVIPFTLLASYLTARHLERRAIHPGG